jgi:GTP-binding protein Era
MLKNQNNNKTKCGFVAVVGRPNAGKSSLLNWLIGEKIAMVSHKANATRKRLNMIALHHSPDEPEPSQIIFIDTPGLHEREKLLNKFMLQEALNAIGDCDFILFLAPITDSVVNYKEFLLKNTKNTPHIVVLTKTDFLTPGEILTQINLYKRYENEYENIIPISIKKGKKQHIVLDEVIKHLPTHPFLYDEDILTNQNTKEIYKELIREAVFDNISEEIPYETDVIVSQVKSRKQTEIVSASIIVGSSSQKGMLIGSKATTIKRIGISARKKIEKLCGKKVFTDLKVEVKKGWSKSHKNLKQFGYV